MSSQAGALRPFHPLSGSEVKQIILDEIKKKLDGDSRFANNISYPLISWKWRLAVNAYPSDKPEFSLEAGGTQGDPTASQKRESRITEKELRDYLVPFSEGQEPIVPLCFNADGSINEENTLAIPCYSNFKKKTIEPVPIQIDHEAERSVTAPAGQSVDAARSDAGLPIPYTRSAPGPEGTRVQIDAPALPLDGRGAPKPAEKAPASESNVPGPKGIVARRATARTKAAPEGLAVEKEGTAPSKDE